MGTRIIQSGIGSYTDPEGRAKFGFLGDEVEVHDDDLERFDRLNPAPYTDVLAVDAETIQDEAAERAEFEEEFRAAVELAAEKRAEEKIAEHQATFDEAVRVAAEKLVAEIPAAIVEREDGAEVPVGEDGLQILEAPEGGAVPAAKPTRRTAK
jgi:hypothetical protein